MHFDVTQQFEVVFSKIIINLQSLAKLLTQNIHSFSQPKTTEKKLCLPNQCFSKIFWPDSTFESMLLYGLELFIVCHHLTKLGGHGH